MRLNQTDGESEQPARDWRDELDDQTGNRTDNSAERSWFERQLNISDGPRSLQ